MSDRHDLRIAELEVKVTDLTGLIERLTVENAELRARLAMNSRTSSKPPSSDGYAKPAPKSRRVRSGKKPGKQPGDPGHHLAQRTHPDATCTHVPEHCRDCGKDLANAETTGIVIRQVFDLPPVALFCTEHRAQKRQCDCGKETTAEFPAEATAPACYGPVLRAYVCYLVTRQHIPIARVAELLRDAYGAQVSTGVIISMVREGAAMLEEFLAQMQEHLVASDVVHADETGLRVEAKLAWVHALSTTALTLYHLDDKRGTDAMDAMGVIEHLQGVLVHDGWAPYRKYKNVTHALCNSHHCRELEATGEVDGQGWAKDMIALLCETWHLVLEAKADGRVALYADQLVDIHLSYDKIIAAGHAANPELVPTGKRGRAKRTKSANLLRRLDIYSDDVLRFCTDFRVGFDNNLSERDIRMVKIAQKISGGFRSTEGAKAFLACRSYLSTANKNGVPLLDALKRLFIGNPWMPEALSAGP